MITAHAVVVPSHRQSFEQIALSDITHVSIWSYTCTPIGPGFCRMLISRSPLFFTAFVATAIFGLSYANHVFALPPSNDDWANRIQISMTQLSAGFSNSQDLTEATTQSTDPNIPCKVGNPDDRGNTAWYGLTTGGSPVYLRSGTGSGFSSVMTIVTGTPGSFKNVVGGCNDDGDANFGSALNGLLLAANTSYSIMVGRPSQSSSSSPLAFTAGVANVKRVTKTSDTNDGVCDSDCSLREAIQTPNGGAIELLLAGNYTLTLPGNGENLGNTGDLDISKGVYIYGAGAGTTSLSTTLGDRLIDIDPLNDLIGPTVGLFNLTIRDGGAASFFGTGGCINSALQSGAGAGAGPANEFVVLSNVVLDNCRSALGGGALSAPSAPIHIVDSTVKNSTAGSGGGGLVFNQSTGVSVAQGLIERSTISGNTSDSSFSDGGGGIQSRGSLVLVSSTVSGNRAKFNGGGILVTTFNGRITMIDSTVTNNVADYDGNASGQGGGIRFDQPTTSTTAYQISNTVFADNRIGSGTVAQDCHAAATIAQPLVINVNRSWFQAPDVSCAIIASGNVGNTINQAALLGTLDNNGGPTQTVAPQTGSPLIDNFNATICGATDQRGAARPQDGDGNTSILCDIGAVEVNAAAPDAIFKNGFED
jgi:CSLREA domain-containing protein